MSPNQPGRVALVYPFANLDSVPSLINTANLLAENGYLVDIFTHFHPAYVRPVFSNPSISLFPIEKPWVAKLPRFIPYRFSAAIARRMFFLGRHRQTPYRCVIAVDPVGLVVAENIILREVKIPLVYYSLELLLSYELKTEQERSLKSRELRLSRQASFVIIQDEQRAALLAKDNNIPANKIVCVPNSPLGPARFERATYFHEKFGLNPETKVILHTGTVSGFTCALPLVRSTRDWPDNWVLVCHTRQKSGEVVEFDDYVEALLSLAPPGRVFFSTDPLPHHEYDKLIHSADVGVAFYCVKSGRASSAFTQDNIRHIGLSSGKTAYYLRSGVPILVNDIESLKALASDYQCGEWVADPMETRDAIETILKNYEAYSRNAMRCFEQALDFAPKFAPVLDRLARLS